MEVALDIIYVQNVNTQGGSLVATSKEFSNWSSILNMVEAANNDDDITHNGFVFHLKTANDKEQLGWTVMMLCQ